MTKASVCMLAYNTSPYIGQAIESALSQKTNFDFEIVISENCSTDDTRDIVLDYRNRYPDKIKVILNPVNIGMPANFVLAYRNCAGKYIATLDSDDYWCDPNKLQKQVDFLESNPDYGVVYSDSRVVNENNEEIEWDEMDYYRSQFTSGYLFFRLLKEAAFILHNTTCFRKDLIKEELERDDLWYFEDWWLYMRLSIKTKMRYMNWITSCYRMHQANATNNRMKCKTFANWYKAKSYAVFYSNVTYFDEYNRNKLSQAEKELVFRKVLMLLYRPHGSLLMKIRLIPMLFRYFPGFLKLKNIVYRKWVRCDYGLFVTLAVDFG